MPERLFLDNMIFVMLSGSNQSLVAIMNVLKGGRKMKKVFRVGVVLLAVLGSVALVFAEIRETQRERGGPDLQNVHDRVLCVDGFKVFQTIVFGFVKDGGAAVSNIQLMEEQNGNLVPVRCSK